MIQTGRDQQPRSRRLRWELRAAHGTVTRAVAVAHLPTSQANVFRVHRDFFSLYRNFQKNRVRWEMLAHRVPQTKRAESAKPPYPEILYRSSITEGTTTKGRQQGTDCRVLA